MSISIQGVIQPKLVNESDLIQRTQTDGQAFVNFFNAAVKMYDETNDLQLEADQKQLDLITGKSDNLIDVMMSQEKAYTALQFSVQVTNKVIDSYKEIMRMQI